MLTEEAKAKIGTMRALRHVTDPQAPVYGIVGLPEEVVAVLLAYVSRSPKSFRTHLAELLEEGLVEAPDAPAGGEEDTGPVGVFRFAQEKARAFHERWVVNYGHSSVAEHAVVHLGVEGISRLASAALELSNPFLSFTEFSQRYQAPQRGAYVVPPECLRLGGPWPERFAALMERLFDAYETLRENVAEHALATGRVTARHGESAERTRRRALRAAFEDARYALPLAVRSSLGMTANGRALRDAIATLRMDPLAEVRELADRLCEQGQALLPTLLRHTEPPVPPPPDAVYPEVRPAALCDALGGVVLEGKPTLLWATGLDATAGAGPAEGARAALRLERAVTGEAAPGEDPLPALARWRKAAGPYADGPDALHAVRYRFALTLSEAAWHQLLRHVRGTHFAPAPASTRLGTTVPPAVQAAGGEEVLRAAARDAEVFAEEVIAADPLGVSVAAYVVLNAHRRTVVADLDLWELDHLVRLRLRDNAQWDVRRAVRAMAAQALAVHPFLAELWGVDVRTPLADEAP